MKRHADRRFLAVTIIALAAVAASSVAQSSKPTLDYYKVVGNRNLFRKLGWRPPNEAPQYTLLLTAVSAPVETQAANVETDFWSALLGKKPEPPAPQPEPHPDRALIAQNGSNSVFYIGVGDRMRNFVVKTIETGRVTMATEDNKETQTLTLQEIQLTGGGGPSGGPPGGGGGRARSGGQAGQGATRQRRGNFGGGGTPPDFEQMRQRFQNMSPEEREQMRNQFRQRGGNGGGNGGGDGGGGGQGRG